MRKIKSILFIPLLLIAMSCTNDDEGGVTLDPVSNAVADADYGAVVLKWELPSGEDIDYVNVKYTIGEQAYSRNFSKFNIDTISGMMSVTVEGFPDTNEYEFELTSYNTDGGKSEPVFIKAAPLSPAYDIVVKTVSFEPDFGGCVVSWINETGKMLNVVVSYPDPDNSTRDKTVTFTSDESGKEYITDLPANPMAMVVSVSDQYNNSSAPISVDITPLAETQISKDTWSIPGYVKDSPDATVGYSSQDVSSAGTQGRAVALIEDDDNSTFWHASWKSPNTSVYPHWIVIDLGKEVIVSRVVLTRRKNNKTGQLGQQFLTCKADGVVDANNSETWNWEDQGEFSFDINTNDAQSYRLVNNPKTRYLKLYFAEKYEGIFTYAMLGDLQVFGQE